MKLDPAVLQLLELDAARTTISPASGGGSSSASTARITTTLSNGTRKEFFMKSGSGPEAEIMFKGEHASLNALHDAVPGLCPRSYGHGKFTSSSQTSFLVSDFLVLTGASSRHATGDDDRSLVAKLAKLHATPAPVPEGCSAPQFGFPVTTCCGDTPQDNSFRASWADFYADNRLRFISRRAEARNGKDVRLGRLIERTASEVVPRLLRDGHLNGAQPVVPVVVHGDLWSGNAGVGAISGQDGGDAAQDVVYDPSACYAHSEYELGIMKMFGGFGAAFFAEYHRLRPKTDPVDEYEDRMALYELYHYLNHYALFGGHYKASAVSIMERLLGKYST